MFIKIGFIKYLFSYKPVRPGGRISPALPQPVVEGPSLLQFPVALQQQRLQVVAGVGLAEPPEHLRLVAGLDGHHLAFHTSTLAPVVRRS